MGHKFVKRKITPSIPERIRRQFEVLGLDSNIVSPVVPANTMQVKESVENNNNAKKAHQPHDEYDQNPRNWKMGARTKRTIPMALSLLSISDLSTGVEPRLYDGNEGA